jgi:peptide/nickel transport system substrate-binding protein
MTNGPGKGPVAIYYSGYSLQGTPGFTNQAAINDPVVNEMLPKIRLAASTDQKASFKLTREMVMHVYDQAYAIPRPAYRTAMFWWPWIKNYSGENSVGYYNMGNWAMFAWIDQPLKKSMGY